jgi:hypothetical protein
VCDDAIVTGTRAGAPATLAGAELKAAVKRVNQARRMRAQLDKRADGRIAGAFAEVGLKPEDLRDRARLQALIVEVKGDLTRRHGGGFALRVASGLYGVRRETRVDFDSVRSAEFAELRRITETLRAVLVGRSRWRSAPARRRRSTRSTSWPPRSRTPAARACRSSATRAWAR